MILNQRTSKQRCQDVHVDCLLKLSQSLPVFPLSVVMDSSCVVFQHFLEDHTCTFLDLAYHTHFQDRSLITFYCAGLNEPLKCKRLSYGP